MTRRPSGQLAIDGRPMTEAELQRHVIALARDLGWGVTQAAAEKVARDAEAFGIQAPALEGLVFHPRYSLGSEPGWPDLTLIRRRDRRLVFAELKGQKGSVKPRQEAVLDLLRSLVDGPYDSELVGRVDLTRHPNVSTIEVHIWRPSHLADGTIEEVLR